LITLQLLKENAVLDQTVAKAAVTSDVVLSCLEDTIPVLGPVLGLEI